MPLIDHFDNGQPPTVVEDAAELYEPRPQAVRDPLGHPDTDFRRPLYGIFPAGRFFQADGENAADRFAAQDGAVLLRVQAVDPRRVDAAAALAVEEEDVGEVGGAGER